MQPPINIILVEDSPRFREGLKINLQVYGVYTLAEAANGRELLHLLETHTPDVLLLDLRMPVMNGSETMSLLAEKHPHLKVIILSAYDDQLLIDDYMQRGARAYVPKDLISGNTEQLAAIIRKVHRGGIYNNHTQGATALKLSARRKQIIYAIAAGKNKSEIAAALKITRSAVSSQEKKIMALLGAGSRSGLFSLILEKGLHFFSRPWQK